MTSPGKVLATVCWDMKIIAAFTLNRTSGHTIHGLSMVSCFCLRVCADDILCALKTHALGELSGSICVKKWIFACIDPQMHFKFARLEHTRYIVHIP